MRRTWSLMLVVMIVSLVCTQAVLAAEDAAPRPAVFNVTAFGAVGDGATLNTQAIQRAIDACAEAGGGTVLIPAGRFVTGAIWLRSHVTLEVGAGCTLLGSENFADYPVIEGRWEGLSSKHYASLINGKDVEQIAITGRGTIDARGKVWWEAMRAKKLEHDRGRLIGLYNCTNVRIDSVTLRNSPAWTVNPIFCDNVTVDGITIINPADSPNTDGINPDSSRNVHIANCHLDVGDDCITIKSGKDEDGRKVGRPCENITVTNCTMLAGHGGVVIGSEMSGGVNNVTITNCVFDGTDRGIRMKTQRGRGGVVQNIRVSNIVMRHVGTAISMDMFYHKLPEEPVSERTPAFRHVHISNIMVNGAKYAAEMRGLPEMPIEDFTLANASFETTRGIRCSDAKGLGLHDVQVNTREGAAISLTACEAVEVDGLKSGQREASAAVLEMKDVREVFVRGCLAVAGTDVFCQVAGGKSADIRLAGNHLAKAARPIVLADDVDPQAVKVQE